MKKIFVLFILMLTIQVSAEVWKTRFKWNEYFEQDYSNWVRQNWRQTIFTEENSLYHGLETDCADATYAMRALYSYMHGLPFVVHTADGKLLKEESDRFDHIMERQDRFRAFMSHVFKVTDTRTLVLDTYPIAINRDSLRPGVVYVSPGVHSYQIIDLNEYGIITTLSSTSPVAVRVLFRNVGFPFYIPSKFKNYADGFRAFRWPSEMNEPVASLRRTSFEQFELAEIAQEDYFDFIEKIIFRLKRVDEPLESVIDRSYENLCYFARERGVLVIRSYGERLKNNEQCFDRETWQEYSTVHRDKRLESYFLAFRSLRYDQRWQELPMKAKAKLLSVFVSNVSFKGCVVETSMPEKSLLSMYEVWNLVNDGKLISDPNASILQRWGLKPYEPICPQY